ncbi:hypothetical protein [Novosphingobium sp. JCM 18896]|uniref:hypothetical protein n=1 Tax=Novosphingobium sp. JCM 18896 TaxID=2989731 RepID=UPI002223E7A3|nr:hypothetical protein [Novosphingobium sp. JCM 18896]MCW1431885.1 hypothetical protein [Novosphingobium sp. JCM 18896]
MDILTAALANLASIGRNISEICARDQVDMVDEQGFWIVRNGTWVAGLNIRAEGFDPLPQEGVAPIVSEAIVASSDPEPNPL